MQFCSRPGEAGIFINTRNKNSIREGFLQMAIAGFQGKSQLFNIKISTIMKKLRFSSMNWKNRKLRTILRFLLTIFVMVFSALSCQDMFQKEEFSSVFSVDEAKSWYEARAVGALSLKSGNVETPRINIKPIWEEAVKTGDGKYDAVETPLLAQGRFGFATSEGYKQWKATNDHGWLACNSRLVVMKNKKDGTVSSFIMTIFSDKATNGKKDSMKGNSYLKKGKDFTGYVFFHELDGRFANGWKYECGKATHTVRQLGGEALGINLKAAEVCRTYEMYSWVTVCTDYYTLGYVDGELVSYSFTGTSCSSYQESVGSYSVCTPGDGGSGSGSGGSSSGGFEGGSGYYAPPAGTQDPCSNYEICPLCGGYIISELKSGEIPSSGIVNDSNSGSCLPCCCEFDIDIDGYDNLNDAEKKLVRLYPVEALRIGLNRNIATDVTVELFGFNGRNDKSDAFRHAYFQALNCSIVGYFVAKKFGDAHEENTDQPYSEKAMDLHNNSVGYEIGRSSYNIREDVMNALNTGQLLYLNKYIELTPTNQ